MTSTTYQLGDVAYIAKADKREYHVTCPDCGGTGQITCIMHDQMQVSVECGNCRRGYESPSGYVVVYENRPQAERAIITGINITEERTEYQTDKSYRVQTVELFPTQELALAHAQVLADRYLQEQLERVQRKEKDSKSWAWNASYHRKCLRTAEENIKYHTAKLNVASVKKREDKASKNASPAVSEI